MDNQANHKTQDPPSPFMTWLKGVVRGYKSDQSLRDSLEDYIRTTPDEGTADITPHERAMLANVLKMRDLTVVDVMIPRADIVAIDEEISRGQLTALLTQQQYSRFPVYRGTLDDVIGTVHIKDILANVLRNYPFTVNDLLHDVPVVSPTLPVSDLILQMRASQHHMVMVVDEHGGIDGLVTIGDVIETVFGELNDDSAESAQMIAEREDGTVMLDGRLELIQFEEKFGSFFSEDEKGHNDTIAGLVSSVAGRVPVRGEIIRHEPSGLVFEIIDGNPRRVYSLRLKNIPLRPASQKTADK